MRSASLALAFLLSMTLVPAGAQTCPSTGPDVIVGSLPDVSSYGSLGGIAAFAVGTTSCNIGRTPLVWIQNNNQHPVIGQNMFRYKDGRFEMIGMSWLKHAFTALQGTVCQDICTCTPYPNGTALGVGCSDPYSSGLNGSQGGLGPRAEVNATTGFYPYPFCSQVACAPATASNINRRLQVLESDLNPTLNAGALYYVEGQYVNFDDSCVSNKNNNASYRRVGITLNNPFPYNLTFSGMPTTVRMKAGIYAWQANDPLVQIKEFDIQDNSAPWNMCAVPPNPVYGRLILGWRATYVGGPTPWRYVYALQKFEVPLPQGATTTGAYFHDVFYHSGEQNLYNQADWPVTIGANGISWEGQTYAQTVNANAIRWSTMFTFEFFSTAAPDFVDRVIVTPFKPGPGPATYAVSAPTAILSGACAAGNVGADVLKVNGSAGGLVRRVDVGINAPITLSVDPAPGNASSPFVLWGWARVLGPSEAAPIPPIGTLCAIPCSLNPGDPQAFKLHDDFGLPGCAAVLPNGSAPWSYVIAGGLPAGINISMQGVMFRNSSFDYRVTNALLLRVSDLP
jgi:hypothetical protein